MLGDDSAWRPVLPPVRTPCSACSETLDRFRKRRTDRCLGHVVAARHKNLSKTHEKRTAKAPFWVEPMA